jgi:hypothetical protein
MPLPLKTISRTEADQPGRIWTVPPSRDGALRRPRRVQRRNMESDSGRPEHSFSPLNAGWDIAARRPYHTIAASLYSDFIPRLSKRKAYASALSSMNWVVVGPPPCPAESCTRRRMGAWPA